MNKTLAVGSIVAVALALAALNLPGQEQDARDEKPAAQQNNSAQAKPDEASVKRTREVVQMIDDIYKQTIVLITDKYVNDVSDFAAGSAAVELFRRIGETGFHQVRLLDVTGEPYDPENVAKTDFEKESVKKIKAGESYAEKVVTKDGKPYLLAMTAVPVVMEKCVMCHPHYEDVKKGAAIGVLSYELPIK